METVRNLGKINIMSDLDGGEGKIKVNDFLSNLTIGFSKQVSKYLYYQIGDVPFAYRERQLNAFFAPALSKIHGCFFHGNTCEAVFNFKTA